MFAVGDVSHREQDVFTEWTATEDRRQHSRRDCQSRSLAPTRCICRLGVLIYRGPRGQAPAVIVAEAKQRLGPKIFCSTCLFTFRDLRLLGLILSPSYFILTRNNGVQFMTMTFECWPRQGVLILCVVT